MSKYVLITGGVGFIGAHLAEGLLTHVYRVRALDNLSPQVHGEGTVRPLYLSPDVELMVGDVRDAEALRRAAAWASQAFHSVMAARDDAWLAVVIQGKDSPDGCFALRPPALRFFQRGPHEYLFLIRR